MTHGPTTVLLDLDGTLVDPSPGILDGLRHALTVLGKPVPEDAVLRACIGPPLRTAIRDLQIPDEEIDIAVGLYRERYGAGGLFQARAFDGIEPALARLADEGRRLVLCTSKLEPFATRVVDHFGLTRFLSAVYGARPDGAFDDKGDLIAHILKTEGVSPDQSVMVGDRRYDVLGAARHGVPTLGVLWGFGDADELTAAGAAALVERPEDLADALIRLRPPTRPPSPSG